MPVAKADFDAAWVVAVREDVGDRALDLAAGGLVGFEEDGDGGAGMDLAVCRNGHFEPGWVDSMLFTP